MSNLSHQISIADKLPTGRSAQFLTGHTSRLTELVLVTVGTVLVIKILTFRSILGYSWFVPPAVFVAAAFIPAIIKGNRFPAIGLNMKQVSNSLVLLGWTCIVVFPVLFAFFWLMNSYGFGLPLKPVLPQEQSWICWLSYQFFYVAVAEEVFFRGYLQANILNLASSMAGGQCRFSEWISIAVSAACFALAHIIIQGQFISVLTFLPGLVLGWLFVRSGTLLSPILFHGLTNSCYLLMATALARPV
jgi:membrane protease YdiL (CAAX protease family)